MYDKILIPTDGSEAADEASSHAFNLAEKFASELHVLYVIQRTMPPVFSDCVEILGDVELCQKTVEQIKRGNLPSDPEVKEKLKRPTDNIADKARERGIDTVQSVRAGKPNKEIIQYAKENDIEMIVMGSHGRNGLDRMIMGSTTDKVLKLSQLPVVVIDTFQT